ncbi:nicotinamide riboside transporter PnuC [Inhella sp.]|uniref:nicotinamide riboside transporter PnuC n=1 Tax=Inhella sp. TaxID=1921806 RepID=UPI0035AE7939
MNLPGSLELAANAVTALSILLAARNHLATWPLGILGCLLFGWQFWQAQLYADATLQLFFIATSAWGWWHWQGGRQPARAVSHASGRAVLAGVLLAVAVCVGYGGLLQALTDAWMPFVDAAVLGLSVVAQWLLMQRKLATWGFWLAVNTLSVPLFASRGLTLTAVLYAAFWVNALYGYWHWRRQLPPA